MIKEVDFWSLLDLISLYIPKSQRKTSKRKHDSDNTKNGKTHDSICLSIALRYFAGANPYNLMTRHGVGMHDVIIII